MGYLHNFSSVAEFNRSYAGEKNGSYGFKLDTYGDDVFHVYWPGLVYTYYTPESGREILVIMPTETIPEVGLPVYVNGVDSAATITEVTNDTYTEPWVSVTKNILPDKIEADVYPIPEGEVAASEIELVSAVDGYWNEDM